MGYLLRVDKLSDATVASVAPSFDRLPETDHKDGKYRLRRYSKVRLLLEPKKFQVLDVSDFTQSAEYNKFQGDVERKFENLEQTTLDSEGFTEIVYLFRSLNQLSVGTEVDIHQMRVITLHEDTPGSPEGFHQDGYDCIAMFGIRRHNISGGELLVSNGKDQEPFVCLPINDGTGAFLDDQALWHNATDINPEQPEPRGYMDSFILTANK